MGYSWYSSRFSSKSVNEEDETSLENLVQTILPESKLAVGEKPRITFKDILGIDDFKEELQEIVAYLKNPRDFESMGAVLPRGVLLAGPPGTGKTMLAKAIAGEANCAFYYMSGSQFDQKYVFLV